VTHRPSEPIYKGEPLDAARGPGLGCFWIQVAVLVALLIVTPLSVIAVAPPWLSGALLIATLVLLLFTGQTVIFLLRLVAADRRTRRRPMARSARRTVGDLEAGVEADDAELAWSELDLPQGLVPLYEAAVAEAHRRLERAERVAPFAVVEDDTGGHRVVDADLVSSAATKGAARVAAADPAAEAHPGVVATVTDARLRLPGLRRPAEAIRIELEAPDGTSATVAIRYESEGAPRYRYWPPVMAARAPAPVATPGADQP